MGYSGFLNLRNHRSPHRASRSKETASAASDCRLRPDDESLLGDAGFESPFVASQLTAGRNNQVYRITDLRNRSVVLKRYFHHEGDRRNRLEHEWKFLVYGAERAAGFIPKPIGRSLESRVALLEYIPGEIYDQEPTHAEVRKAIRFIECLNENLDSVDRDRLPVAADACFEMTDHIRLLEHRLKRLERATDPRVISFIREDLSPRARTVIEWVERLEPRIRKSPAMVSPSDFGFHNAVRRSDNSRPCFLDFEYAGWDSAEKLIADFFSQPDIPIAERFLPEVLDRLQPIVGADSHRQLVEFTPSLLALHALKWCCILLNDFLAVDSARRSFSGNLTSEDLQFSKVQTYFETVCLPRVLSL